MKRLLFFLLLAASAFGQGAFIPPQVALRTVNGITYPLANATITVCVANAGGIPCAPVTISIFRDSALTQPLTNPFTADANGNYIFAASGGTYTVTVTGTGFAGYSYQVTVGQGITIQTNGTNNASQSVLNLVPGTNVTLTNTSGGNVAVASSTSPGGGLAAPPGIGLPVRFSYNFGRSDAISSGVGHGIGCTATQSNTFNATSTETSARLLTSAASASLQTVIGCGSGAGANPGQGFTSPGTTIRFTERLITQVTSNFRYWIGILDASGAEYQSSNAVYTSDTPNRNYCAFRLSAGTDTTWKAACATSNTLQTVVDTGVSPSTTASFVWEITFTPVFAPTQANFFINGTQVATITTNLPSTSSNLSYGFMADNKNTATAGSVAYFYTQFFEK